MPISTSVPLCVPTQKEIPTSEIPRVWRACKMLSHSSDPPSLATEDQEPKSILRTAGTDYMFELVSIASAHCWKPYWNRVSENEGHSLQFREGTRLRNDPRNKCRFDVLLDSHESIVFPRFGERKSDGILELGRCASLVHASQTTHNDTLRWVSCNYDNWMAVIYLC